MTGSLPIDSRLLLGYETSDDAAVWKVSDSLAAVLTVDFFTPIVDDPYDFGCVAATNALSDVFAMGAQPHVALNLLALDAGLGTKLAATILQGGADKVHEAGAFVCGGHTIDDPEPKYGLCVFGSVDPNRIIRNEGAQRRWLPSNDHRESPCRNRCHGIRVGWSFARDARGEQCIGDP